MAGYSRIYGIGELAGFLGVVEINPILQALGGRCRPPVVGLALLRRQPRAVRQHLGHGSGRPGNPDALVDACIAFAPRLFASCAALARVAEQAGGLERLDFDLEPEEDPGRCSPLRGRSPRSVQSAEHR